MDQPGPSGMKRARSNTDISVPATRRRYETRPQDKHHEQILMDWLEDGCESDSEIMDENFSVAESDHNTHSEQEDVDEVDKKCSIYNSGRRTRRWSMAMFFRILDLSAINASILYNMHSRGTPIDQAVFLKCLARSLVVPHMQCRFLNSRLPRELRSSIKRVIGSEAPENQREENIPEGNQSRKLSHICPSKLKRKTAYKCDTCTKHVCLQCSKPVCKDCL